MNSRDSSGKKSNVAWNNHIMRKFGQSIRKKIEAIGVKQNEDILKYRQNCRDCFHSIDNQLGTWCLRYHVYVFPEKGQGRNCQEFIMALCPDGPPLPYERR